ncbi:MAG: hypothetical protein P8M03_07530 [Flavobacteriaceae bacterium]|nr:hypothetical protein [Flavobacteriaceae bacterium]
MKIINIFKQYMGYWDTSNISDMEGTIADEEFAKMSNDEILEFISPCHSQ